MSDESRLLAAWCRIGVEVPARVVNSYERVLKVQIRLAKCSDNHEQDIKDIRKKLCDYREYCKGNLSASIDDPEVLEKHATALEEQLTSIEKALGLLEEYCTGQGH